MSRSGLTTADRERGVPVEVARPARRRVRPDTPSERRRRRVVRAALALAVVAAVWWALWYSPLLAVRTVRVDGATTLTADQVRTAAGVPGGTPLLRVDVDAAAARVARLPQVASVEVTRGWPRSVVVTVVERRPVAVVERVGTRSLVDADGILFDTVTGDAPDGVVPLDVATPGPDDPATRAALGALVSLPREVRAAVAGARAGSGEDVTLTLTDGTTVVWGGADDAADKSDVLVALLDQVAAGNLEPAGTIDVSAPGAVVLR
ncbi:cell division protein FtsQ [Geodermatophilus bullaregiensis]|uniref:cell division protein FtsQ/DivIB n=1 Tax=Geodermatophilus bullaregiensis TaxID=1564160 RepID=UPI0027DE8AA3|nr:FtsQ-type POTRA domain-containing protein [Geodermatophilus bullaregiensis]MBM7804784.1 cell division protein FtsQ [Geodermatophilus bullaregiensis]